ncbi:MAG: pyridoxamine 5'-phosphate oxidase family protein [Actinomycetota bacterium]|nr:pyridoxamine 5'-phosphate oxidase family protein [Actinomycetota bacterium]MED5292451.1 pyridoxamine 5'-phosphate oxidase family protein [Actinomycetota bacterium]
MTSENVITDIAQLDALYGAAMPRSISKEISHLNAEYQAFIEAAPFMAVATVGFDGLDCSPRGENGNVVRVIDENTIQFADRRGNNRLDTLRNILSDNRIALLFLVPGIGETMRINGRASISASPDLLETFTIDGKSPKTVVEVKVDRAYFQCSKALVRSGLWDVDNHMSPGDVPSAGQMLEATAIDDFDALEYDRTSEQRNLDQLW